ncbi:DUF2726 domain-containing protein [Candidatus Saccharibacteria bacterium]|nr:DUF2726 domain-containing protein [Candidatus Saccharibacteria bacterium]
MQGFLNEMTKQLLPLFVILVIIVAVLLAVNSFRKSQKSSRKTTGIYELKPFLTASELSFYQKLKKIETETRGKMIVAPQVNLATIIKKISNDRFQNELFRNIDFAIFTHDYQKLLLLIELNDSSHNQKSRYVRDYKVRDICAETGVELMTFYTDKPNETSYMISRVIDKIKEKNETL